MKPKTKLLHGCEHACDGSPPFPDWSVCASSGSIFSAILSTITGPIGGALTDINQIRSSILKTEQQVLWPARIDHSSAELYLNHQGQLSRLDESGVYAAR